MKLLCGFMSLHNILNRHLSLLKLTWVLPWKWWDILLKSCFSISFYIQTCQELHLKWLADATLQCGDCLVCHRDSAVSGCTIHFRPVRLIRHSSEEATGHCAFISRFLTEAELRNGLRKRLERCSFNLSWPPTPTGHIENTFSVYTACTIQSMGYILIYKTSILSFIKDAWCVHSEFTNIFMSKPSKYIHIRLDSVWWIPIWENDGYPFIQTKYDRIRRVKTL